MQFAKGSNLPKVKRSNQTAIQRMIYHCGPITRAEVAEHLGLTLPTITTNINQMIASGIVQEVGNAESSAIGRKANLVDIVPNSRYFLGIEIRGAFRRLCITDFRGQPVFTQRDDRPYSNYEKNIRATCRMIKDALNSDVVPPELISGIAVCLPGLVNSESGILNIHPGYHWVDKAIRQDIETLTGFQGAISVENNACARAFGARLFRNDLLNNISSFAYLYISAGIACPLFINSSTSHGILVGEGEVGHMTIAPKGPKCSCGKHGCLEAFSSDRAIISQCLRLMKKEAAPILTQICADGHPTIEDILHAQERGEEVVSKIVETAVKNLGIAIANIDNFVRPHSMLIEGKLFISQENRKLLLTTIHQNLYTATFADTRFVFVDPDEFSGAKGAAAVAISRSMEADNE